MRLRFFYCCIIFVFFIAAGSKSKLAGETLFKIGIGTNGLRRSRWKEKEEENPLIFNNPPTIFGDYSFYQLAL